MVSASSSEMISEEKIVLFSWLQFDWKVVLVTPPILPCLTNPYSIGDLGLRLQLLLRSVHFGLVLSAGSGIASVRLTLWSINSSAVVRESEERTVRRSYARMQVIAQ